MNESMTTGPPWLRQHLGRLGHALEHLGGRWRDDFTDALCRSVAEALREAVRRLIGGPPTPTSSFGSHHSPVRPEWGRPGSGLRDPREDIWDDEPDGDEEWNERESAWQRDPPLEVPTNTVVSLASRAVPTWLQAWKGCTAGFRPMALLVMALFAGWGRDVRGSGKMLLLMHLVESVLATLDGPRT